MRFGLINIFPNMNTVTPGVGQNVPLASSPSTKKPDDVQNEKTLTQSVFATLDTDKKNNVDYSEAKSIFNNAQQNITNSSIATELDSAVKDVTVKSNVKSSAIEKFNSLASSFLVNFGEQTVSSSSQEDLNAKSNELTAKLDSIVDAETQKIINSANDTITKMYTDAIKDAKEKETLQLEADIASKFDPQPGSLESDGAIGTGTKKKYGTSFATKGTITLEQAANEFGVSVDTLKKFNPKAAEAGKFENGNDIYIPQNALKSATPTQKAPPKTAITPLKPNAPSFEDQVNGTTRPLSTLQTPPIAPTLPKAPPKIAIRPLNPNSSSFAASVNSSTSNSGAPKTPVTEVIINTSDIVENITGEHIESVDSSDTPVTEAEYTGDNIMGGHIETVDSSDTFGSFGTPDILNGSGFQSSDFPRGSNMPKFGSNMPKVGQHNSSILTSSNSPSGAPDPFSHQPSIKAAYGSNTNITNQFKELGVNDDMLDICTLKYGVCKDLLDKQNSGVELSKSEQNQLKSNLDFLKRQRINCDENGTLSKM